MFEVAGAVRRAGVGRSTGHGRRCRPPTSLMSGGSVRIDGSQFCNFYTENLHLRTRESCWLWEARPRSCGPRSWVGGRRTGMGLNFRLTPSPFCLGSVPKKADTDRLSLSLPPDTTEGQRPRHPGSGFWALSLPFLAPRL